MKTKSNFLRTTSKDTADQLTKLGFQLVSKDGSTYTFLNKGDEWMQFFDNKALIAQTNILHM